MGTRVSKSKVVRTFFSGGYTGTDMSAPAYESVAQTSWNLLVRKCIPHCKTCDHISRVGKSTYAGSGSGYSSLRSSWRKKEAIASMSPDLKIVLFRRYRSPCLSSGVCYACITHSDHLDSRQAS